MLCPEAQEGSRQREGMSAGLGRGAPNSASRRRMFEVQGAANNSLVVTPRCLSQGFIIYFPNLAKF